MCSFNRASISSVVTSFGLNLSFMTALQTPAGAA